MRKTTRLKKPQIPELDTLYRFDDLGGRPKYGGVEMTSATSIPSFEEIQRHVDGAIAEEAAARGAADDDLEEAIEDLKNSPDVVDIVATYADLQAYDTSSLGDKDIIRVLDDETHDDMTTYYRWNLETQTWTFVGGLGPYYTKEETDEEIEGIHGRSKVLSADDYNWNSVSKDTTEPYDSVALWLLDNGMYTVPSGFAAYRAKNYQAEEASYLVGNNISGPSYKSIYQFETAPMYLDKNYGNYIGRSTVVVADGTLFRSEEFTSRTMVEAIVSDYVKSGNGAPSGVPIEGAGLLYEDKTNGKLYQYDGSNWEEVGAGPTIVQTTGTSTTDIMSQNAVTGMVFADPSTTNRVRIGNYTSTADDWSVAIGSGYNSTTVRGASAAKNSIAIGYASSAASSSTAIGSSAKAGAVTDLAKYSVALGTNSDASYKGSVALGARSATTRIGEVNVGTSLTEYGYNSTNYRVIGGVHDPVDNHDAATKGYVDGLVGNIESALYAINNGGGN